MGTVVTGVTLPVTSDFVTTMAVVAAAAAVLVPLKPEMGGPVARGMVPAAGSTGSSTSGLWLSDDPRRGSLCVVSGFVLLLLLVSTSGLAVAVVAVVAVVVVVVVAALLLLLLLPTPPLLGCWIDVSSFTLLCVDLRRLGVVLGVGTGFERLIKPKFHISTQINIFT